MIVKCYCDKPCREFINYNPVSLLYRRKLRTCRNHGKNRCRFFEIAETTGAIVKNIDRQWRHHKFVIESRTRTAEHIAAWQKVKQREEDRVAARVAAELANSNPVFDDVDSSDSSGSDSEAGF